MTSLHAPRILVVKLADIGDVLLTTPALRLLRASYPQARIDYLTTANGALALRGSTLVNEIIQFDKYSFDSIRSSLQPAAFANMFQFGRSLRQRGYDMALLFHHLTLAFGAAKFNALLLATGASRRIGVDNGRGLAFTNRVQDLGFGGKHEAEYALDVARVAVGIQNAPLADISDGSDLPADMLDLDFYVPVAAHKQAEQWLGRLKPGPCVALFPGSGTYSLARRWPAPYYAQVADALQRQGVQVIIVGRASDDTQAVVGAMQTRPALDLTDQGDLGVLAAVLARMDLLLTNDAGPMHIASAVGTPVVAVFGLSNHLAYGPWDRGQPPRLWPSRSDAPPTTSRHTVVRLGLGCQPCLYRGYGLGAPQGCPTRECLTLLPATMVLNAVKERLKIKD